MEKDSKLAPIIGFNTHFNYDPYSDEELLVVNSPHKITTKLDKGCMTDSSDQSPNKLYVPSNLDINLGASGKKNYCANQKNDDSNNNNNKTTNALIIGEIPINLNDYYHKNNCNRDLSQMSINYIDSPCSPVSSFNNKTPVIPYLILPFSSPPVITKSAKNEIITINHAPNKDDIKNNKSDKPNKLEEDEKSVNKNNKQDETTDKNSVKFVVQREQWNRKTEFLLAIIGFSVDLGNIWRFPKVVYDNGGGRFLIPYFVQLALCGLPLFYMELALGQFHQTGLFTLWEKICPILKGLAFTAIIIDLFMAMFYNTVIAWAVYYLILSFRADVDWKKCGMPWNTLCCFPINENRNIQKYENLSLTQFDYQKSLDFQNGFVYQVHPINQGAIDKRIVMFNTQIKKSESENISSIFKGIGDFFTYDKLIYPSEYHQNYTATDNLTSEYKIESWLKSYYVILNNTIVETPRPHFEDKLLNKYAHDPVLITSKIEQYINDIYSSKNQTVNIVLNCAKNLNNPTQEYYTRYLTQMHLSTGLDDLGGIKWEMIICLFIVFTTVYFALWKGIKSAGKAVWITAIAPYIVMFILLIRGITLDGSEIGIDFYLGIRDWNSLFEMKVWVDAATQIFFSLGPGFGTIIALSSYNKKTNDCYKDALLTSFINCFTSILSGFVVFSTLGHMAHVQGKSIEEVTEPGPGLIFITYPQAISMMPFSSLWAIIFFFMLFTLGIDSTFGGLESVITGICDTFPDTIGRRRSLLVLVLIIVCFVAALPTVTYGGPYIVHLFDNFAVAPSILIVVFLEIIGVMYAYGCDRFCWDLEQMINRKTHKFWIICWKYISPAIVVVMTVMICRGVMAEPLYFGIEYEYIGLGQYLAALIIGVPISFIILYVIYRVCRTPGTLEEVGQLLDKINSKFKKQKAK